MYPDNQTISLFGETVEWPGVGADGKFTNGDFANPLTPPSRIPADTINLLIDNISELITKLGGTPNNIGVQQLADAFTAAASARKAIMRDENGRAKISPRPANVNPHPDDIARYGEVADAAEAQNNRLNALEGRGGPITARDFGTATPTQQELTRYACESVWGEGGAFAWNAADPRASTYAVAGIMRTAGEVFNATWVRNTFAVNGSPINHRLVLTNTPNTTPPVFSWEDVGVDTVAFASNNTPGIVKGSRSISADPLTGSIEVVSDGHLLGGGRNLLRVLNVSAIPEAMAVLRSKCDGEGIPDFWDLRVGDYLDIPSLVVEGVLYPSARILISGFNHYKNLDQEGVLLNTKNHILFTFDKIILRKRMNASNTNTGGYPGSELRGFLEGVAGTGEGPFANGLRDAIGDYLYTIKKYASIKGSMAWGSYTVFPPTALEVGASFYYRASDGYWWPDDEDDSKYPQRRFPIYEVRRYQKKNLSNNQYDWYWMSSPVASYASDSSGSAFCNILYYGVASSYSNASSAGGVAPAFCVA
jgi:hypothetical protein